MRYSCDFETTSGDEWLQRDNNHARIWAWCSCCVNKNPKKFNFGTTLNSFFQWCFSSSKTLYFHNLAYDGEYIISYLLKNGFKFTTNKDMNNNEFTALISEQNAFYSITIKYDNKRIKIFDSLKIIPLRVEKIAESWNMEQGKGEIDYTKYRPIGHKLTLKEKEYIKQDVKIVAVALADFMTEGYKKMTIGSNAFNYFKKLITTKRFRNLFPILPLDVDADIRLSYKGGYVYLNPKYANKRLQGISFDVNSLYPFEMHERALPFGLPLYFSGKYDPSKNYPLYIQKLNCRFILKEGKLPTIQLKNNSSFLPTQYIEDSENCVDLVLTNVDLELFFEHYDVFDVQYLGGYKFHATKKIFNEYIDHFMQIKANSTGGKRQIAKLFLNSLYGKFATNPIKKSKSVHIENGVVHKTLEEPKESKPKYTAMACFITAYARYDTITSAQKNYDRFIYADTDSISLVGYEEPTNINIDDKKLGYWKNEGIFFDSIFLKAKTYIKLKEDGMHVTCCGMPDKIKEGVTFDNFKYGAVYEGKLSHHIVNGGCILHNTTFSIKEPTKKK